MRKKITVFIEFFHFPFLQFIPKQTWKYLFCGVTTVVVDWVIYFLSYNFIFAKQNFKISTITLSSHIAAKCISVAVSFVWGFLLNKYIVFTNSTLRGRQQLFRYLIITLSCIIFSMFIIKYLVEYLHCYPTLSNIFASVVVAFYSYLIQRKFTFKVHKN